jgi:chromate transporter
MRISTLSSVFFKLGTLGFGGPPAHIALMREEVVEKRKWLTEQEFFDLVGATNLIPGPNSTELAIHIGHKMLGWRGLFIAGASFILPAFFAVLLLAILYVKYGSLPELSPVLSGIRPVIVAIVALALFKFRESAVRNWKEAGLVALAIGSSFLGVNEILVIFLAGALCAGSGRLSVAPLAMAAQVSNSVVQGSSIFLFFLKIGSFLFGSGYVLLAFLKNELVDQRMWLTNAQLLDAITVGQVTPGPVFTTATFIGYLLQGYEGAIMATLGIFLPSFFFVALSAPFISKLRTSAFFSNFLDGVNAASFALMGVVTFELGVKSLIDLPTLFIGIVSFFILRFTKINSAFPILAGGIIGYFLL